MKFEKAILSFVASGYSKSYFYFFAGEISKRPDKLFSSLQLKQAWKIKFHNSRNLFKTFLTKLKKAVRADCGLSPLQIFCPRAEYFFWGTECRFRRGWGVRTRSGVAVPQISHRFGPLWVKSLQLCPNQKSSLFFISKNSKAA